MKIKATVWTHWCFDEQKYGREGRKPKCIFNGEIASVPNKKDWIGVRKGFSLLPVDRVSHNFVNDSVEITVDFDDRDNEYGDSLL